ncbi:MAG: reverse transcriptase domain-containing protein, partial [Bacteroidota bacterium]
MKRNGVYRARLVAQGFSQIPGVDFTESYSPVVNDVTFRVVLTRMIVDKLDAQVVDIDNAFLNGDLEHEIYMKIPDGYKECLEEFLDDGDCLKLLKSIYGLVQAARQYWRKVTEKLKAAGFKTTADPCLLYKEGPNGICMIVIYIDDMLLVGHKKGIEEAISILKMHFQVKDPTGLEDYLGVEIKLCKGRKNAWLGQPTILKSLEKQFGKLVEHLKGTVTPGTPGFVGGKQNDEGSLIEEKDQKIYRSGVGTLLYLTKHSRPDIANPVCELSKSMDGASMFQMKELLRVICYVLDTKELGLKMEPKVVDGIWKLTALSDSDFASDKETRLSVYGYVVYFCGVPVAWKSKSMRSV